MANRWGKSGNSDRFYFLGLQNHWMVTTAMKLRHLLLGRKAMTNLDSILKSRDIILLEKVLMVKDFIFPVVTYGMWELDHKEGWAPKNWCFQIVVLEKTLETWIARRSNPSILKEINPEYSLEGLMLKLRLQCFGHLMERADSLEKDTHAGKIEGRQRCARCAGRDGQAVGWQRMR